MGGLFSRLFGVRKQKALMEPERCFYMNFKLLNLEETFPKLVRAKVRAKGKSDRLVRFAGCGGRIVAANPKFWSTLSNTIADKLTVLLPAKMSEKGLTFKLTKVHCGERGFVVLRAELVDVDLWQMLESAKGTEFGERLGALVGAARRLMEIANQTLVPLVQEKIMEKLEVDIPKMLKDKAGFNMMMIMKTSAQQADFFFSALEPDRFEATFVPLNEREVMPKVAKKKVGEKFGGESLLGQVAGAIASRVAGHVAPNGSDEIFRRVIRKRLSWRVPEYAAEVGVTLSVSRSFVSDDDKIVLYCEVNEVDLAAFKRFTSDSLKHIPLDESCFRLGHKGRQDVYREVRQYLQKHLPDFFCEQTEGLQMQVSVHDRPRGEVTEMPEIELSEDESV